MRLLLDQGLPRSSAEILRNKGWDIQHTGEIGRITSVKPARSACPVGPRGETFEKCSFLSKFKERENFNRKNTLSILRIKI